MKKLPSIFALTLCVALLAACSEQVKIQSIITDGTGRWDIDEFIITHTFDTVTTITEYDDVGEMIFYESGKGIWIQYDTILLVDIARYFEWENTENDFSFQFDDLPAEVPEKIYTIMSSAEDSIHLQHTLIGDSLDLPNIFVEDLFLKRIVELDNN